MTTAVKTLKGQDDTLALYPAHGIAGIGPTRGAVQYISGSGTVTVEATIHGEVWEEIAVTDASDGTTMATTINTTGLHLFNYHGYDGVRVRLSTPDGDNECVVGLGVS